MGLTALNQNRLRINLRQIQVAGTRAAIVDAEPVATITPELSLNESVADLTVSSVTAASPIVVTTSEPHGLSTGNKVVLYDFFGVHEANGSHVITVSSSTVFSLDGTTGTGADIPTEGLRYIYALHNQSANLYRQTLTHQGSGQYYKEFDPSDGFVSLARYRAFIEDLTSVNWAGAFFFRRQISARRA